MHEKNNAGKKWPWIIVASILGVVGLSYWTVQIAISNPVEMSDLNMQDYRHFDHDVNKIIMAKAAFDKQYDLLYVTEQFAEGSAVVKFKLTDKTGQPVNDANMTMRITRPGTHEFDQSPAVADVTEGVYTFQETTLPAAGRWDVLLHVITAGKDERYMNLKADTRYSNVFEY